MVNNKRHRNRAAKLHQTATASTSSTPHRKQLHLFHKLRVRRAEVALLQKRFDAYLAREIAIRRPVPLGTATGGIPLGPSRITIQAKEIARLNGRNPKWGQQELQLIRCILNRDRLADITIKEYAICSGLPEDEIRASLNKWDREKWERVKARMEKEAASPSKDKRCRKSKKDKAKQKIKVVIEEITPLDLNNGNDDEDDEYFDDTDHPLL